jgi:MFS family permease
MRNLVNNMAIGYDQGVMSGLVTNADFLNIVGHPSATTEGIMLSIYNLGCFSGCVLNFFLGDYFGRRRAIWISMAWVVVRNTSLFGPHRFQRPWVTDYSSGWSHTSNLSLQPCTFDGWPLHYWHRHGN